MFDWTKLFIFGGGMLKGPVLNLSVPYHGVRGACLILHWLRNEAKDRALGAGSQEICQWAERSRSLGEP